MSDHSWRLIRSAGLRPGIHSLDDYTDRILPRLLLALNLARSHREVPLWEPALARRLHRFVFEPVHLWAGEWRKPGQLPLAGGLVAADGLFIRHEMDLLYRQSDWLWPMVESPLGTLAVSAFHHARFETIHPFLDGNGRIGRILLDGMLHARGALALDLTRMEAGAARSAYLHGLKVAPSNLRPLVNVIAFACGVAIPTPDFIPPPFRMAPRRREMDDEADDELFPEDSRDAMNEFLGILSH